MLTVNRGLKVPTVPAAIFILHMPIVSTAKLIFQLQMPAVDLTSGSTLTKRKLTVPTRHATCGHYLKAPMGAMVKTVVTMFRL
ncbi:hypothetical protein LRHP344_03133 [Lacticaseibacillus rhamnosus]|nr:hypothetical protein LRHP344_03133 [Lacticaseibacillus rhamnosus]